MEQILRDYGLGFAMRRGGEEESHGRPSLVSTTPSSAWSDGNNNDDDKNNLAEMKRRNMVVAYQGWVVLKVDERRWEERFCAIRTPQGFYSFENEEEARKWELGDDQAGADADASCIMSSLVDMYAILDTSLSGHVEKITQGDYTEALLVKRRGTEGKTEVTLGLTRDAVIAWRDAFNVSGYVSNYLQACDRLGIRPIGSVIEEMQVAGPSSKRNVCVGSRYLSVNDAQAISVLLGDQIEKLVLRKCSLQDDHMRVLFPGISRCTDLLVLDFSHNDIQDIGSVLLGKALLPSSSSALKVLDLSDNRIGDEGANGLVEMLSCSPSLERLTLSRNEIGSQGAKALASTLERVSALAEFDISSNPIGSSGFRAIARKLPSMLVLKKLCLGSCHASDRALDLLGTVLREHEARSLVDGLDELRLEGNRFSQHAIKQLLESGTVARVITLGESQGETTVVSQSGNTKVELIHGTSQSDGKIMERNNVDKSLVVLDFRGMPRRLERILVTISSLLGLKGGQVRFVRELDHPARIVLELVGDTPEKSRANELVKLCEFGDPTLQLLQIRSIHVYKDENSIPKRDMESKSASSTGENERGDDLYVVNGGVLSEEEVLAVSGISKTQLVDEMLNEAKLALGWPALLENVGATTSGPTFMLTFPRTSALSPGASLSPTSTLDFNFDEVESAMQEMSLHAKGVARVLGLLNITIPSFEHDDEFENERPSSVLVRERLIRKTLIAPPMVLRPRLAWALTQLGNCNPISLLILRALVAAAKGLPQQCHDIWDYARLVLGIPLSREQQEYFSDALLQSCVVCGNAQLFQELMARRIGRDGMDERNGTRVLRLAKLVRGELATRIRQRHDHFYHHLKSEFEMDVEALEYGDREKRLRALLTGLDNDFGMGELVQSTKKVDRGKDGSIAWELLDFERINRKWSAKELVLHYTNRPRPCALTVPVTKGLHDSQAEETHALAGQRIARAILRALNDLVRNRSDDDEFAAAHEVIGLGLANSHVGLDDEILCQLACQLTRNPSMHSLNNAWRLMVVALRMLQPDLGLVGCLRRLFERLFHESALGQRRLIEWAMRETDLLMASESNQHSLAKSLIVSDARIRFEIIKEIFMNKAVPIKVNCSNGTGMKLYVPPLTSFRDLLGDVDVYSWKLFRNQGKGKEEEDEQESRHRRWQGMVFFAKAHGGKPMENNPLSWVDDVHWWRWERAVILARESDFVLSAGEVEIRSYVNPPSLPRRIDGLYVELRFWELFASLCRGDFGITHPQVLGYLASLSSWAQHGSRLKGSTSSHQWHAIAESQLPFPIQHKYFQSRVGGENRFAFDGTIEEWRARFNTTVTQVIKALIDVDLDMRETQRAFLEYASYMPLADAINYYDVEPLAFRLEGKPVSRGFFPRSARLSVNSNGVFLIICNSRAESGRHRKDSIVGMAVLWHCGVDKMSDIGVHEGSISIHGYNGDEVEIKCSEPRSIRNSIVAHCTASIVHGYSRVPFELFCAEFNAMFPFLPLPPPPPKLYSPNGQLVKDVVSYFPNDVFSAAAILATDM